MEVRYCQNQLAEAVEFVNKNNPVLENKITLAEAEAALVESVFDTKHMFFYGMYFYPVLAGEDIIVNIYIVPKYVVSEKDLSIVSVDVSERAKEMMDSFTKTLGDFFEELETSSPDTTEDDIDKDPRITHNWKSTLQ